MAQKSSPHPTQVLSLSTPPKFTQHHQPNTVKGDNFGRKFKFKGGNSNFSNGSIIKSLFVRGKGMIIILLTVNHGQIDHDLITFATDFDPLKAIIRVPPYHFPAKISPKFTQPARGCTPPNVGWGGWVGVVWECRALFYNTGWFDFDENFRKSSSRFIQTIPSRKKNFEFFSKNFRNFFRKISKNFFCTWNISDKSRRWFPEVFIKIVSSSVEW